MVRTTISLDEGDKRWLDEAAGREGVAMTEFVRRAIKRYREHAGQPGFDELLDAARCTWKGLDGLHWQRRMRGEWDDRAP